MEMYHARKTTYADGCISYVICPESIQGRKPAPRQPIDREPFTNTWVYDEIIEHSHSVAAAADTRHNSRRQTSLKL